MQVRNTRGKVGGTHAARRCVAVELTVIYAAAPKEMDEAEQQARFCVTSKQKKRAADGRIKYAKRVLHIQTKASYAARVCAPRVVERQSWKCVLSMERAPAR